MIAAIGWSTAAVAITSIIANTGMVVAFVYFVGRRR